MRTIWLTLALAASMALTSELAWASPDNTTPQPHLVSSSCDPVAVALPTANTQAGSRIVIRHETSERGEVSSAEIVLSSGDPQVDAAVLTVFKTCRFAEAPTGGKLGLTVIPIRYEATPLRPTRPAISQVARYAPGGDAYPAAERRRGTEGTTKIRFFVSETGLLQRAEVTSSSGSRSLDATALVALSRCAFVPGRATDGRHEAGDFEMSYVWRLK